MEIGIKHISRLTYKRNIFEALGSQVLYFCGIYHFDHCVFRRGECPFFDSLSLTPDGEN